MRSLKEIEVNSFFFFLLIKNNKSNYLRAIHNGKGLLVSEFPLCMTLTIEFKYVLIMIIAVGEAHQSTIKVKVRVNSL